MTTPEPPDTDDAAGARIPYDPREDFSPDVDDWFDYRHEGADRAEARETAAREWRAR